MNSRRRAPWRATRERAGDVVAVADEGDRPAAQRPEVLAQRETVGERLARMLVVAERVHDVEPRRRGGELGEHALGIGPDHHGGDPALEVARDVGHRLARAERFVGAQRQHVAAELVYRDLERRSRPQRRLFEQHRDVAPGQLARRRRVAAEAAVGLDLRGEVEAALELRRLEAEDGQEVLSAPRHLRHRPRLSCGTPR
jgi:hypothetical protein